MTPTDLDALAALLAAATAAKGDGRWRDENTKVNAQMDYLTAVHDPDIIISLIEAARREAELREVLAVLVHEVDPSAVGTAVATRTFSGSMGLALERARSLLHDNAGTATGDEVGEP